MDKGILKKIPGFRSDTLWKKIVAVFGYLYFFYIVFNQTGVTFYDRVINSLLVIVTYGTVYVLVFNIGNIRDKIYFFNRPKSKAKIVYTFIGILLTVVVLNFVILGLTSLKSEEQLEFEEELNDTRVASYMDTRIEGIGPLEELTTEDIDTLEEIVAAYESMTPEQKSLLTQEDKLKRARNRLEELREEE